MSDALGLDAPLTLAEEEATMVDVAPRRRGARSRTSLLAIASSLLSLGFLCAFASQLLPATGRPTAPRRLELTVMGAILGSEECNTEYDTYAFVLLDFALILYTFLGLAIVCDEYFCESLEQI